MDMMLQRLQHTSFGIFGSLLDDKSQEMMLSLEHSYLTEDKDYEAKIPDGVYTCMRGAHKLGDADHVFETFEIRGVTGHSGLLFHAGNFNKDSEGCVLLGMELAPIDAGEMLLNSRTAFQKFMALQNGVDTFTLTIVEK